MSCWIPGLAMRFAHVARERASSIRAHVRRCGLLGGRRMRQLYRRFAAFDAVAFAVPPSIQAELGVRAAEAGLLPGMLYYLSRWFPTGERAKANSLFLASLPLALAIGGPVSGAIMGLDGVLGLSGWRWLFLLEGLPSVILGAAAYFVLRDSPDKAGWLTSMEKQVLARALEREISNPPPC